MEDFKDQKEIGHGSYGLVKVGHYNQQDGQSQQVVVKVPRDVKGNEREFLKEARHLNSVNGNPNIMSFIAISISPFGLTTSNSPFGHLKTTELLVPFQNSCLADLQYEFKRFEHVFPVIAKEVTVGLKFLHENGIAHRDLKPANILLSNDHCIYVCGDELEFMWGNSPVVCKLADFGEGRSNIIQTKPFCHRGRRNSIQALPHTYRLKFCCRN